MKNIIISIIIIISIFGVGYYLGSNKVPNTNTVTLIDTVLVPHDSLIYKPGKTIKTDTTIYVPVPEHVDTAKILKDYFALNIKSDSLVLRDSSYVLVKDTITKNDIKGRTYIYHINDKYIKETKTVVVYKQPKFSLGVQIGYGLVKPMVLSPYIGVGIQYNIDLSNIKLLK